MALSGKLEAEFELQSTSEQFYAAWRKEPHQFPNHTSSHIKHVDHHDGDWDSHDHGSIKIWKYYYQGKEEVFKEKVEFDDANKKLTLTGLDGHVMEPYKVYNCIWQVTPKGNGSIVKCKIEYEGRDETIPPPYGYFDFIIGLTKGIDKGLTKP